ncbi:DUF397 domain-containing protein [Streptomyces sp. B6B3]|uniref:DUF397 domain-containing protein n=1 Tax=Streptomyces sp. B6B3 TaxID=3153570 RepID=UPI00325EA9DD
MNSGPKDLYAAPLDGTWTKSSYSPGDGPDCVEIMRISGGFAVRDSKNLAAGVLRFPDGEMRRFGRSLAAGHRAR